jgi:hypothetical protein
MGSMVAQRKLPTWRRILGRLWSMRIRGGKYGRNQVVVAGSGDLRDEVPSHLLGSYSPAVGGIDTVTMVHGLASTSRTFPVPWSG